MKVPHNVKHVGAPLVGALKRNWRNYNCQDSGKGEQQAASVGGKAWLWPRVRQGESSRVLSWVQGCGAASRQGGQGT